MLENKKGSVRKDSPICASDLELSYSSDTFGSYSRHEQISQEPASSLRYNSEPNISWRNSTTEARKICISSIDLPKYKPWKDVNMRRKGRRSIEEWIDLLQSD